MVSAAMKCVKYLLFIFNFTFLLTGIALVAIGTYVYLQFQYHLGFVGSKAFSVPLLLIIVGCVITVIAFFGCCGAIKENYCMMMTFSILLAIIFILELAGGIAAYVFRGQLEEIIKNNMRDAQKNYNETDHTFSTRTWDVVQHDFHCCGLDSYKDWEGTPFFAKHHYYPNSCCKIEDKNECGRDLANIITDKGCFQDFFKSADQKTYIVGGVGVGIAFVQFIGIIFACCLASSIKREYEVV